MVAAGLAYWIAFASIFFFISIHAASKTSKASKKRSNFPLWENLELKRENREQSYILNLKEVAEKESKAPKKDKDYSLEFIKDIYDIIYARQNPSREECKSRRFSVIQMSATSFEGTGSLLKQIMISTAIALHSNRTLVWGLGLPFPFEVTRELWNGPDSEDILINGEHLNCSQHDITFGPLGCFFQPVSTCTLEDSGPAEVIEFSHNPYNDSARLTMAEMRKGIAMYHPPMGLLDYIWSKGKYPDSVKTELISKQAYLWASAVAAYVFRVKPALIESFQRRFDHLFQNERGQHANDVWGVHIRHGDLRALSNIYSYKEIFDFDDYFEGLIKQTHEQKYTPDKVFIATDSLEADNIEKLFVKYLRNRKSSSSSSSSSKRAGKTAKKESFLNAKGNANEEEDEEDELVKEILRDTRDSDDDEEEDEYNEEEEDEDEDEDEDEEEDEEPEEGDDLSPDALMKEVFYGGKRPVFMTVLNNQRYRTEHGSHTVAANGGCFRDENYEKKGMRCALNYEAIVHYQAIEEHRSVSRPMRMLRVYLESIEDLYILSRCTSILAQGSSHYSTLAGLLMVAGHGTKKMDHRLDFLDQKTINTGVTPTAYLHGMNMLNGTNAIDGTKLKSGSQRWIVHSNHFISGLPDKNSGTLASFNSKIKLTFDPWAPENRIHIENGLPHISDQLFYLEARTWLGSWKYKPSLPGHCPGPLKHYDMNSLGFLAELINLGVEHLQFSHNSQAMQCWHDAVNGLNALPPIKGKDATSQQQAQHIEDMKSVANGNMQTMRIYRYSEMIVNELKTIKQYYIFTDKYMKQAYDRGIDASTSTANKNKPLSLEEVNEKILNLEKELESMKSLRDRLIKAHEVYMNNNYDLGDKGRLLTDSEL